MNKIIYPIIFLTLTFNGAICQTNNNMELEKIINEFVLNSHHSLSFQNGINVFIDKPKNDADALKKGFRLMYTDTEQKGGWSILSAKDVRIERQSYRAVLYEYKEKKYIALFCKEEENKYYFRIFDPGYND